MQVNFLEKLPKLVALQIFQSSYVSVVGNPSTTILYRIIITHTLNIFLKTLHILQKRHKLVAKFWLPNLVLYQTVNSLRPWQNGRHFADDTFRRIFLNENLWTLVKHSLKIVPKVRINNIPALVQIMAWHRPGDKPLSEPMMVSLPTHICVTRPQWVNGQMEGWTLLSLGEDL